MRVTSHENGNMTHGPRVWSQGPQRIIPKPWNLIELVLLDPEIAWDWHFTFSFSPFLNVNIHNNYSIPHFYLGSKYLFSNLTGLEMEKNVSPEWNLPRAYLPTLDGLDNEICGFWVNNTWDFELDLIL